MSGTVSDFGRVGRLDTPTSKCTFMVVSESAEDLIRRGKPSYRRVIVLTGYGYAEGHHGPGQIGAIDLLDPQVEWLDD